MIENYNINDLVAPLFSQHHRQKCYLGLSFQQGKRKMIQINVPAEDLPTLLQAKPSENNDPDSGKNRPEVKGHAEEIKDYIIKRVKHNKPWIMGTLTANVDPNKIEYKELGRGVCFVSIPRGTKLDITDGQHRKRAIHELIESHHSELIGDNDFPITLVLEEDFNQCQTDFRDMAQSRQLDQSLLVSFGEFEGRVGITKQLIEQVNMFKGKTEKIKRTPSSKYKLIYTSNYIASAVGCAFENDKSATLEDYNVEAAVNELAKAFNQFFDKYSQTQYIANQDPDKLTVEEIDQFKENSLLGVSIGLEILGRLLYYTYDQQSQSFNTEKVSQLAQLDWSRNSPLWENNVVTKDPNPKNPAKPYKISVGASNVKIAVNTALSQLGWMTYN
ncbi:MAG: DNA sulfur modification protein DndB [Microcoleaceae cyanobacterium]